MITYTVHESVEHGAGTEARADEIIFVKEGFSWGAFLVPFLWLIYHRMWLVVLGYVALVLALDLIVSTAGIDISIAGWLFAAINLALGLEGNQLRRWTLDRGGFSTLGIVSGQTRQECEFRFFSNWLGEVAHDQVRTAARPMRSSGLGVDDRDDAVIGLFPNPGR